MNQARNLETYIVLESKRISLKIYTDKPLVLTSIVFDQVIVTFLHYDTRWLAVSRWCLYCGIE